MSDIARRLRHVQARIEHACLRAGRSPFEVRLLAVSKKHPPEAIRAAVEAGQTVFGENYVQELVRKSEALSDLPAVRFRLIGNLQKNKAKDVLRVGASVDTVDSEALVEALAKRAQEAKRRLEILLQVNVAGDPKKAGCTPEALPSLLAAARAFDSLEVKGLFTVPPLGGSPAEARPHFRALRALAERHGLSELSMGMSEDLEVAVEEGATWVRVGTAIFGPRGSSA